MFFYLLLENMLAFKVHNAILIKTIKPKKIQFKRREQNKEKTKMTNYFKRFKLLNVLLFGRRSLKTKLQSNL